MVEIELARPGEETDRALDVAEGVWGARPVTDPIARAMEFAGWYLSVARDGGELVGMCAGFVGIHGDDLHLHSHLAAVVPRARGRGIGRALKRHQREWCLAHGIETATWTFDPLVRENARFNLHHLGATGARYLVDLYGAMDDEINRGQPSDRLLVRWDLRSERTLAALDAPLPAPDHGDAGTLIPTPTSITVMRRDDPDEALRWRMQVRESMVEAFDAGYRVTAMTADHQYVLSAEPT